MASRGLGLVLLSALAVVQWTGLSDSQITEPPPIRQVVANTLNGPVRGVVLELAYNDLPRYEVDVYRGIPFAQPPVGNLRFAPPVYPHSDWTNIRPALEYGASCIQNATSESIHGEISEDCLFVNVFTPSGRNADPALLPVMVWIYGGSYRDGSSTLYNGALLAAVGEVVVVTLNYRLGAFGFLSSTIDDKVAGNMGFLDQQSALLWVNKNIAGFRGNPEEVTIFGESAGAGSVSLHLLSHGSRNLFKRAIAESGSMLSGWAIQGETETTLAAQALAQATDCLDGFFIDVRCLRQKSADEILAAQNLVYTFYDNSGRQLPYTPVVDGEVFTASPTDALRTQDFAPVELLAGVNKDEWGLFLLSAFPDVYNGTQPGLNTTMYNVTVERFTDLGYWGFPPAGSNKAVKETVKFAYTDWLNPSSAQARLQSSIQVGSDFSFFCPLQSQANYWSLPISEARGAKLYVYQFSHKDGRVPDWAGVVHGAEVVYVFGYPLAFPAAPVLSPITDPPSYYTFTEEDRNMSLVMMSIWTAFAKTGNPNNGLFYNGTGGNSTDGNSTLWEAYRSDTRPYMDINTDMAPGNFLHNEHCQLLGSLAPKLFDTCKGTTTTTSSPPDVITTPSTVTAPPPEGQCTSEQTRLYVIIALAVALAVCLCEVVFLCFRVRSLREAATIAGDDSRKGLLPS